MGDVIGPIMASARDRFIDWFTMREVRAHVKTMQRLNPEKYKLAINYEKNNYQRYLKDYVEGARSN